MIEQKPKRVIEKKCFDWKAHLEYYANLKKEAIKFMSKGICPVCKFPIENHRRNKKLVCENILNSRLQIKIPTFILDGVEYEVNASIDRSKM